MPDTPAPAGDARPRAGFTQEVRFAVVMYGGASLAIYINGVAQELLRVVRATAPDPVDPDRALLADADLSGPEAVYRQLSRMLVRGAPHPEQPEAEGATPALRTRFVVDILTGSSAGGINAIFLAKALANDQDLDELKKLWVTEGDIGVLINDQLSYESLRLDGAEADQPFSLLNSQRMYLKLLEALRGMDTRPAAPAGSSPLADELDLFVTATDIPGRIVHLRLADELVEERRHRNVFHFRYRGEGDSEGRHGFSDFGPRYNAFLAFAARATSAHQAAFSPVSLGDVAPIVAGNPAAAGAELGLPDDALRAFYRQYLLQRTSGPGGAPADPDRLADAFQRIWFNDGGTLDNKPFSFVSDELPLRQTAAHVDRKLLYVEPSPEHFDPPQDGAPPKPRIVGNAWSGLSTLPRYETVTEDLTRLLERNRLVERVSNITADLEDDIGDAIKARHGNRWPDKRNREDLYDHRLAEFIAEKGASWGGYQRLRIGQATDDLTHLVARAAGLDETSDEVTAVRQLVRHWRRERYDDHDPAKKPEINFLLDFDFLWTMRRIRFVLRKADELACFDERSRKLARLTEQPALGVSVEWPEESDEAGVAQARPALRALRDELARVFAGLRSARSRFWAYRSDVTRGARAADGGPLYRNPFRGDVDRLGVTGQMLRDFLKLQTEGDRRARLNEYLSDAPRREAFERLVETVRGEFAGAVDESREAIRGLLRAQEGPARLDPAQAPSYVLRFYYNYFEDFDQVSFPVFFSTSVGEETDVIDVFRVSPEDARAIVDERQELDGRGQYMHKLAGTTLGNFGAFFERKFRVNDITWGRLDGAERIIAALVPADEALRDQLTREAHRAIIVEEAEGRLDLAGQQAAEERERPETRALGRRVSDSYRLVEESLGLMRAGRDCRAQLDAVGRAAAGLPEGTRWRAFLEAFVVEFRPFLAEYVLPCAGGADPVGAFGAWFRRQYEEGRKFSPDATVESAARATRVLGRMLLGYFPPEAGRTRKQRLAVWAGGRLWVFAEAALQPGGAAYRKLRRRIFIAYLLALLLPLVLVFLPSYWPAPWLVALRHWTLRGIGVVVLFTPLVLTALYHLVWRKTKGWLTGVLRG